MVTYVVNDDDVVFRALADGSRRVLLDRLHAQNGLMLRELCSGLQMTRQAVAKHLMVLERANLVSSIRLKRERLHFINPVPIHEVALRWTHKFDHHPLNALSALKQTLEGEQDD